jgi:ribonuclease BN (tRNA processing enzyme)
VRTRRYETASLLMVDGRAYLIDCGPGVDFRLAEAGFSANQVSRIFVTHLHFDHIGGLPSLLGHNWSSGQPALMQVYGPVGIDKVVDGAVQFLDTPGKLYAAFFPPMTTIAGSIDARDVSVSKEALVYQDDKIKVFAIPNSHYTPIPDEMREANKWKSYSYRFETPHKTIVFTGDTGPSEELVKFSQGADILVSEVSGGRASVARLKAIFDVPDDQLDRLVHHLDHAHLAPAEVGDLAKRADVKMVVLSHISPGGDLERDVTRYAKDVWEHFPGPVFVGRDLDEY